MKREDFENLIKEINDAKLSSIYYVEDFESFYKLKPEKVATGLDIDKHRWYETSTDVYKVGDWFIGIDGASQLYSEASSWDGLMVESIAFEMEAVPSITYRRC